MAMWLAVLCGLAIGVVLNLSADWLPRHVAPPAGADTSSQPQSSARPGRVRWGALLLISIGLALLLHSRNSALCLDCPYSLPTSQLAARTLPAAIYCSLLLLIATIDLEHRLVPDVLILLGLFMAICFGALARSSLTAALAGAVVGGGLFFVVALARPNAMGAGDVKLAFLIGMLTGFPWVLQALVLGILLGGLAAALMLLFRVRGAKQYIPYAPYLVAGGIATLLYGQQISHWYVRMVVHLAVAWARLAGAGG